MINMQEPHAKEVTQELHAKGDAGERKDLRPSRGFAARSRVLSP